MVFQGADRILCAMLKIWGKPIYLNNKNYDDKNG